MSTLGDAADVNPVITRATHVQSTERERERERERIHKLNTPYNIFKNSYNIDAPKITKFNFKVIRLDFFYTNKVVKT